MKKFVKLFFKETVMAWKWYAFWAIIFFLLSISGIVLYPGEITVKEYFEILNQPEYKALIGLTFNSFPDPYLYWISLWTYLLGLILFILSLSFAAKQLYDEIDDKTAEIVYTLPTHKFLVLSIKIMVSIVFTSLLWLLTILIMSFRVDGHKVPTETVITKMFPYGTLYVLGGYFIGLFISVIFTNKAKSQQVSLLVGMIFYVINSISAIVEGLEHINKNNPITWLNPFSYLLLNESVEKDIFKMTSLIFGLLVVSYALYYYKDLIERGHIELPVRLRKFNMNFIRRKRIGKKKEKAKSVRDSVFVRWVHPLEKRFPFTASFVYSDKQTIMIEFFLLVLLIPVQLLGYPGDEQTSKLFQAYLGNPVIRLFLYGQQSINDVYLLFVVSQTLGAMWIILLPLVPHWVKKIVVEDAKKHFGEIIGVEPVNKNTIVFQRLLAVFLELSFLMVVAIIFQVISEVIINKTRYLQWEIISYLCFIILYFSLTVMTLCVALISTRKAVILANSFVGAVVLWYVVGMFVNVSPKIYMIGFLGLVDPVKIILYKASFKQLTGTFLLAVLSLISLFPINKLAKNINFIE